jgi:hypothetical protein
VGPYGRREKAQWAGRPRPGVFAEEKKEPPRDCGLDVGPAVLASFFFLLSGLDIIFSEEAFYFFDECCSLFLKNIFLIKA